MVSRYFVFVENSGPSSCFQRSPGYRASVHLTVAEVYGDLIPVEELVQDVTSESAKNFLQSKLVSLRCLTSLDVFTSFYTCMATCNLGSDRVARKKAEGRNDRR